MKNLKNIFPILIILMMTSCKTELFDCLKGEGAVESRIVELSTISELDIKFPVNIELTEGDAQEIEIFAQGNIIDELLKDSKVDGEKWTIDLDGCADIEGIDIHMTLATIKRIDVESVADIRTIGLFENINNLKIQIDGVCDLNFEVGNMDTFDLDVDGVGIIKMNGNVTTQILDVSGTAEVKNVNFKSETADLDIKGTGNCDVWVEDNLKADLKGSGRLCVKGDPTRDIDINGSFDISDCN